MRRSTRFILCAGAMLVAGCGKTKDAAPPAADTTVAATPPAPPRAIVTVLYMWPKDTAKFEKYYPTHLKIVGDHQQEIGFTKAELTKFVSSLQGTKPEFYRQAELYFPSMEAARAGIATPGFAAVAADFKNFVVKDSMIAMLAEETGDASDTPCPALATVIYGTPTSAADFEAYYPKHLRSWARSRRPSASCAPTSPSSFPTSMGPRRPSTGRPSSASTRCRPSRPASAARPSRRWAMTSGTS